MSNLRQLTPFSHMAHRDCCQRTIHPPSSIPSTMSHGVRRIQGRFTTSASSEAYQRQLLAPVKRWRRGWVQPAGLPEGSTYKVCKWQRVDEDDEMDPETDTEDEHTEAPTAAVTPARLTETPAPDRLDKVATPLDKGTPKPKEG
ncbi:hypothetical protein CC85DRAFT_198398 [Cutaneotrichosporon oleaginosum]|uniref:Uncharacterized protein n=2 Tax=Cutaneotrichosporon oleaginosum TaxID=879819 RepID=A0A0J0XE42_9TREE|nr:uncharacterized protein CC85DRAFT_198398 [Cutaneotrichosporon oleaginosum]KLT39347.1 hypothetical protein CC85DRAFT_198398 [Cutaneotrichosporon oleaginosum]